MISADKYATLTPKERQICKELATSPESEKIVAFKLHTSYRTLQVHTWRFFKKLGIHSRQELTLQWHTGGGPFPSSGCNWPSSTHSTSIETAILRAVL
jgi:DNA-binding NarL/FixJ family response regulator